LVRTVITQTGIGTCLVMRQEMSMMMKTRSRLTVELLGVARVSGAAFALWQPEGDSDAFLRTLTDQNCWEDAVRLLPLYLSPREAIWWGCLCNWHVTRSAPTEPDRKALAAAVSWVMDPSPVNRLAARAAGDAVGTRTSAGCLATAAYWSGGSPPDQPLLTPPPHVTGRLVLGAVFRAAVHAQPMRCEQRYRDFFDIGMRIVRGEPGWPAKSTQPFDPDESCAERHEELVSAHG
jgi:hypothetical protein